MIYWKYYLSSMNMNMIEWITLKSRIILCWLFYFYIIELILFVLKFWQSLHIISKFSKYFHFLKFFLYINQVCHKSNGFWKKILNLNVLQKLFINLVFSYHHQQSYECLCKETRSTIAWNWAYEKSWKTAKKRQKTERGESWGLGGPSTSPEASQAERGKWKSLGKGT